MQQLLKALRGAARAEIVPTELLSQLLVAVDDPEVRAEPSSRTGIPLLRLPDGSKGGEAVEFAVAHHVGPPLNCLTTRSRDGLRRGGDSLRRTAFVYQLASGRKVRTDAAGRTADAPSSDQRSTPGRGAGTSENASHGPLASFTGRGRAAWWRPKGPGHSRSSSRGY